MKEEERTKGRKRKLDQYGRKKENEGWRGRKWDNEVGRERKRASESTLIGNTITDNDGPELEFKRLALSLSLSLSL